MADGGALAFARTAPAADAWMDAPVRSAWLADPLALDAAFQLLSVWSYQTHRAASLPCFAGQYRQFRRVFPSDGVLVAVRITHDNGATARADVEFIDADGRLVARMTDAEHVIDPSLNEAFRRGRIASAVGASTHVTRIGSCTPLKPTDAKVAIVGIGGLFPGAGDLAAFWANVRAGADCSSDPPPGRWPIPPARVLDPRPVAPDKVPTLRGYYLPPFTRRPRRAWTSPTGRSPNSTRSSTWPCTSATRRGRAP